MLDLFYSRLGWLPLLAPEGTPQGNTQPPADGGETPVPDDEQQAPPPAAELRMSQGEFNRRVQERLDRQKRTLEEKYGGKPEQLKERLQALEREAADLKRRSATDSERAIMDAREQAKVEIEATYTQRLTAAEQEARRNAIRAEVAIQYAGRFRSDLFDIAVETIAGDPRITYDPQARTVEGLAEVYDELVTKRPSLLAEAPAPAPEQTPRPSNAAPRMSGQRGTAPGLPAGQALAKDYLGKTYPGIQARTGT